MRRLGWFEPGHGADKNAIRGLESVLGLRLPDDFSEFASEFAGASNPDESEFDVLERSGRKWVGNLGSVLRLEGDDVETILGTMRDLGSQIPPGVVPIVGTGSGDYVSLDFRSGDVSVVYFAHEKTGEDSLIPLASSFADFLEMVRAPLD